jgi:rare lipoprotein A
LSPRAGRAGQSFAKHDDLKPERLGRYFCRCEVHLVVWRRLSANCSAFAKCAAITLLHLITIAWLQLALLESTRAADAKPDECGLASVYSTLSEETASGEDTSAKNLTAAHQSLPFGTLVQVDNQENGRSALVRITDRGPFVSGRIVDLSQVAAHELGFADLTQVCLKVLSIPEKRREEEK